MEIIKSSFFRPRKCAYGAFRLKPDKGLEILNSFIDYESGLLIVSVSPTDESQWEDNGYNGRTIPTRQYRIDLKALRVLSREEWMQYFSYDEKEVVSEDGLFTLLSRRVYDADQDSDGYEETLYNRKTGKKISTGSAVAFTDDSRKTLLETFYLRMEEQRQYKIAEKNEPVQPCGRCGKPVSEDRRYPAYICDKCASCKKRDAAGNVLEFYNIGFTGGLKIMYRDAFGHIIGEDDTQTECDCYIDGEIYTAEEARFGGIVIQRKL